MQSEIAEEEGLFTFEDVAKYVKEKMIRRHPHVFGNEIIETSEAVLVKWDEIKKMEKEGKEDINDRLPEAVNEAEDLINKARKRKNIL